jgi:hypothetical protein
MMRLRIVLLLALSMMPVMAHAQTLPPPPTGPQVDPADTAKVRIGPFFMQPAFGLKNVGLDNNVFNDPADPKKDWTATLNLGTLAGLRYGAARLTLNTSTDYVFYSKYKTERSVDGNTRVQAELRLNRLRPWIGMDRIKTHDRAGFEIDSRAARETPGYDAGVEYRVGFRLGTRLMVRRRDVDFEDEEVFRGKTLKDTLNARYEEGSVQLLYEMSPLSNFRLSGEYSRARFETAAARNSDDTAVFAGIEGKKDAALEGYVDVGWRNRSSLDPLSPSYSTITARAAASFIVWEEVRVSFGADRDLNWSYEDLYTFYVQQGGTATVTWRPHDRFDFVVNGRSYDLIYDRAISELAVLRTDHSFSYGGGVGFFIRGYPGTRLGLMVERNARESVLADRRYDNTRFLTNIGFSF